MHSMSSAPNVDISIEFDARSIFFWTQVWCSVPHISFPIEIIVDSSIEHVYVYGMFALSCSGEPHVPTKVCV